MNKSISVYAPATVANMVCGFDVLGFALEKPADEFKVSLSDEAGVQIINLDDFNLPIIPSENVSGAALLAMLEAAPDVKGFTVYSNKTIKPGSGIGSSAASAAGVVVAANALLDFRFDKHDLIRFAMHGEKVASGVKHADNIAPCIYGGVTLIRSIFPLDIIAIQPPPLLVTVVHPQIEVRTSDARQILKQEILLKDAIRQWGNVGGLVAGLLLHDYELIGRSLEDVIIEPIRSILIPKFDIIKKKCKESGALGGGISGSGPSIFMLSNEDAIAKSCATVMQDTYNALGIEHHIYQSSINMQGVQIKS